MFYSVRTNDIGIIGKLAIFVLYSVICLAASFSLVRNVPEYLVTGKWIGTIAIVAISGTIISATSLFKSGYRITPVVQTCSFCMVVANMAVAILCVLQIIGLASNSTPFRAVADFDNPAGVAALFCVSFPFVITAVGNRLRTKLVAAVFIIDASVLFFIQSRAGLVTLLATVAVWCLSVLRVKRIKPAWVVALSLLMVTVAGGFLYLFSLKSASTNGRMLIINTCMRMVAEHPLLGWGTGGFGRGYMVYQAEYLKTIDNESILILSDNVTHPLSEYMLVTVNYGLTGLSVAIGLIALAVVRASRKRGRTKIFLLMEICSVCVLSLFSYPFRYPITTVALGCCVVPGLIIWLQNKPLIYRKIASAITLFVSLAVLLALWPYYRSQVMWKEMTDRLNADTDYALDIKRDIVPLTDRVLGDNPRYQYSRAVVNYFAGDYAAALVNAGKSSEQLSGYDTELLLGSICQKLKKYSDAELHFMEASYMCPSRITPLYRLFRLYEERNDTASMVKVGHKLLDKPVKVHSHDTRAMRLDVRRFIFKE